jgi:hypothetical protein
LFHLFRGSLVGEKDEPQAAQVQERMQKSKHNGLLVCRLTNGIISLKQNILFWFKNTKQQVIMTYTLIFVKNINYLRWVKIQTKFINLR